jgi:hypothetical protein
MNRAPAFKHNSAVARSPTVPAPISSDDSDASSRIKAGAFGMVMVISKMRSPASRNQPTAVAAWAAVLVRTTGTTRAARSTAISSCSGMRGILPARTKQKSGAGRKHRVGPILRGPCIAIERFHLCAEAGQAVLVIRQAGTEAAHDPAQFR